MLFPSDFMEVLLLLLLLLHPFNGPTSGTTQVSHYQKGKTNLDLLEQLGHMQICTLTQTQPRQHPTTQFFTVWMPFLPPNQQHQSTEGKNSIYNVYVNKVLY